MKYFLQLHRDYKHRQQKYQFIAFYYTQSRNGILLKCEFDERQRRNNNNGGGAGAEEEKLLSSFLIFFYFK